MSTFGDIEEADCWDDDPIIDPLQVAHRLHRLRRVVEVLAGRDLGEWDDVSRRDRDDGMAVGIIIVDYIGEFGSDDPTLLAEAVHNARRHLDGGDLAEWQDLSDDERSIGIELMRLIVAWLQLEGPALMAGVYYTMAADWLRSVGLVVVEVKGWQSRARSSGGFAAAPLGVQWHHTASQASPTNDTNWQYFNSDVAPIGNMTIMRSGEVWIGAAGAANTAGLGGPVTMSRGVVPQNSGNSTTWAIEVANSGVGEPWPQPQIDAYFKASNELNRRFGNKPTDVFTHAKGSGNGWTSRKIDPAKAAAVLGPWKPRSVNSSGTWSLDDIRAECSRRATTPAPQPPTPQPGEDYVNWNPDTATVNSVKDAPPVADTVANKYNDWAMIAFLKTIQRKSGLPVTGKYDQKTATAVDDSLAGK